jgi:transcriptional regulator with XRE-family HTH domain
VLTTGQAMRLAREIAGYSQRGLSQAAGLSKNMVGMYEADRTQPSLYALISLADVLGISIDEYIGHQIKKKGRFTRGERS